MYKYQAQPANEKIVTKITEIITPDTLSKHRFKLAAEAVSSRLTWQLTNTPQNLESSTEISRAITAVSRGVEKVLEGLFFTIHIDNFDNSIENFIVQSSSRKRHYIVTNNDCQCEGHENYSMCYHRALYPVFEIYVLLLRASEEFQRIHAKIGFKVEEVSDEGITPPLIFDVRFLDEKQLNDFFDTVLRIPIESPKN